MELLPLWANFSLILVAALLLTLGAKVVVDSAVALAKRLGISELVVGLTVVAAGTSAPEFGVTLVAAGTSLPEMAATVAGVVRRHHAVGIGALIGSDIFNLLGVLGLAGILEVMTLEPTARGSLLALAGMALLTLVFLRSQWRLSRWEGSVLVALGALRWFLDYSSSTL